VEIALAGNPNVGKSIIFSKLTGVGVISANYPGTTIEYEVGQAKFMGMTVTVIDLPGSYSLAGNTHEERVATNLLYERKSDTVIAVLDATRLERNLVFLFELIESGHNVVVALNMYDMVRKSKLSIDIRGLESILMMPVIPTVATKDEGIDSLLYTAIQLRRKSTFRVRYDSHIEAMIAQLEDSLKEDEWDLPLRAVAVRLLSADQNVLSKASPEIKGKAERLRQEFAAGHGEDLVVHIQRDRFGEAGRIAKEVIGTAATARKKAKSLATDITLRPLTGIPILIGVLALVFVTLVFVGGAIESILVGAYADTGRVFFEDLAAQTHNGILSGIAMGVSLSIEAMLALVVPYILVFYVMLSILEDTGYLVRVVSLLDGVMHRLGLHGRAVIPMVVGFGCNVPAILATKAMGSRRERLILAVLITITVPCSAQTAIIIGSVGSPGIFRIDGDSRGPGPCPSPVHQVRADRHVHRDPRHEMAVLEANCDEDLHPAQGVRDDSVPSAAHWKHHPRDTPGRRCPATDPRTSWTIHADGARPSRVHSSCARVRHTEKGDGPSDDDGYRGHEQHISGAVSASDVRVRIGDGGVHALSRSVRGHAEGVRRAKHGHGGVGIIIARADHGSCGESNTRALIPHRMNIERSSSRWTLGGTFTLPL